MEYTAFAESYSNHPIAISISILKAYGKEINISEIENYDEISGHGIKVSVKGKRILAGNKKLMIKENITYDAIDETGTVVHVAVDGNYAGYIVISDEIKDDAEKAVRELRGIGVKKLVMLTGDSKLVGEAIGLQLGLHEIYAELLPDQ